MNGKKLIAAAIGNCVHVAGLMHFCRLAEQEGYDVLFLGPAVPVEEVVKAVGEHRPAMVAVSYRLTPENARTVVGDFVDAAKKVERSQSIKWLFGGISANAHIAEEFDFFDYVSDGTDDAGDCIAYLRGTTRKSQAEKGGRDLLSRISVKHPYPLLRHHYGEPSLNDTVQGIRTIAESRCLDVLSIGPDQNTQQFFFSPENRKPSFDGAGGVPLRERRDFVRLKEAAECGNYPLLRCYSGTADVMRFAELLVDTIHNAWCAVPLCWYNEIDGRGTRTIEVSIKEAQSLMEWHAKRDIPVEINEPHHWGLRDAPDVISVVMAYISAYNAKKAGVRHYIAQYMFNVPNGISFPMDMAKNLAMVELAESLADSDFTMYRQVRAGLPFLSPDVEVAKGQLAASTYLSMALNPHIIHVVGYCEAEQIAKPHNVIESCKIVKGVLKSILSDQIDPSKDERILCRKAELLDEARFTLGFIQEKYGNRKYPLSDADVLADCVKLGILDAPHIVKNEKFVGNINTVFVDGKCVAYDKLKQRGLTERKRLEKIQ